MNAAGHVRRARRQRELPRHLGQSRPERGDEAGRGCLCSSDHAARRTPDRRPPGREPRAWTLAPLLCAFLLACGPKSTFSLRRPDSSPEELRALDARLRADPPGSVPGARLAALAAPPAEGDGAARLLFAELGPGARDGRRWETPAAGLGPPHLAGPWVLTRSPGRLLGRRVQDGSVVLRESVGFLSLVGAAGDAKGAVAVLSTGTDLSPRSLILLLDERGVRRRLEARQAAGVPAYLAGLALVPWGAQTLSALAPGGREVARLHPPEAMVAAAVGDPRTGAVWWGWRTLLPLGAATTPSGGPASATPDPLALAVAELGLDPESLAEVLPRPTPLRDGYASPPIEGGFADGQWLLFWPTRTPPEAFHLVTPRAVLCLDTSGAARWGRTLPDRAVGAHPQPDGGLVLALASGLVLRLDEGGAIIDLEELGGPLVHAAIDGVWSRSPETAAPPGDDASLGERLAELGLSQEAGGPVGGPTTVLAGPRGDRSAAGLAAVLALAQREEAEATESLVAACRGLARAPEERRWACEALARRRKGLAPVLAALRERVDHVSGRRAAPVAPLAQAVAGAGRREALPLLVGWLREPQTASEDLAPLVRSIATLGDPGASGPITDFLRLYHADAIDDGVAGALTAAVEALLDLDGPLAAPLFEELARDPFTEPALRGTLNQALRRLEGLADDDDSDDHHDDDDDDDD